MNPRPFVLGLLAVGCVTAAAGGAYVAVRHNAADRTVTAPVAIAPAAATPTQPVAETETVVTPAATPTVAPDRTPTPTTTAAPIDVERPTPARPATGRVPVDVKKPAPRINPASPTARNERPAPVTPEAPAQDRPSAPARDPIATSPQPVPTAAAQPEPVTPEAPAVPARPQTIEVVVPASSVVGLQVETSITSETARVEDRVEARVSRDVLADGQLAVPAGSRVLGDVILVERGGKMKEKARLGVRFHTLVLADGSQVSFRTDAIFREGSSPGNESARKIGGAAVGGAILGAILGGAKGAAIGGATGAGAGSAVVMAGDRNPATLPAGTIVTVRVTSPVTLDVPRDN